MKTIKNPIKDVVLIGMMIATIEVAKVSLASIPNVELVSFLIIVYTIFFGKKVLFAIPAFILLEGMLYGFGIWWVMYLYAWPLLSLAAFFLRKQRSPWVWAILSGTFGLLFGALCAIPYFFIGLVNGSVAAGLKAAFTWWIAGIPWDITHGISNFIIMLVLFIPIQRVLTKLVRQQEVQMP